MKRQSLKPIALGILLAQSSLPLLAHQPAKPGASTLVSVNRTMAASPATGVVALGRVEGRAADAAGKPVPNATIRLRDMQTGAIAGTLQSSTSGQFTFQGVTPGHYMAELVGNNGKALAASPMVAVAAGKSVSAFIGLPTMLASIGGFVAANAAVVAVVVATAVTAGVLATQSADCVSPPCEQ